MKCSKQVLLWAAVMSLAIPTIGFTDEDIPDEAPSYTNTAQVMHASNLADAAALTLDEETKTAAERLSKARDEYDELNTDQNTSEDDIKLASEKLEVARKGYADEIERLTGEASDLIYNKRVDGMGWGQIAHDLGVHPGTLGLGHTKKNIVDPAANDVEDYQNSNNEMTKATKRDTNQGWNKNHTTTTSNTKNSKKGADLSADQPKNNGTGSDKNNSGSKSNNGKSQSSKSNNGKGNSKNK